MPSITSTDTRLDALKKQATLTIRTVINGKVKGKSFLGKVCLEDPLGQVDVFIWGRWVCASRSIEDQNGNAGKLQVRELSKRIQGKKRSNGVPVLRKRVGKVAKLHS